jgi:hypothetical protein
MLFSRDLEVNRSKECFVNTCDEGEISDVEDIVPFGGCI